MTVAVFVPLRDYFVAAKTREIAGDQPLDDKRYQLLDYTVFKPKFYARPVLKPATAVCMLKGAVQNPETLSMDEDTDLEDTAYDSTESEYFGVPGRLFYFQDQIHLQKLDSILDEGRTLRRISAKARLSRLSSKSSESSSSSEDSINDDSTIIGDDDISGTSIDVEVFVWNGNSLVGEWECL